MQLLNQGYNCCVHQCVRVCVYVCVYVCNVVITKHCCSCIALCSESGHCYLSSVLLMCSHAVHMNSHKYTHNRTESMKPMHTQSVSVYTHKLLGGVWLLSANFSGRHRQHARLHRQLQKIYKWPGKWCSRPTMLSQKQHLDQICVGCACVCVCVCVCVCTCNWYTTQIQQELDRHYDIIGPAIICIS